MSSDLYRRADLGVQIQSVLFAIGVIAFAFAVGLGFALATIVAAGAFGLTRQSAPLAVNVAVTVAQFVGFLLVVGGYVALRDDRDLIKWRVPTVGDVAWMAGGFAILVVAAGTAAAVASALGAETAQNQVIEMGQQNPEYFLYMIPVTLLFVGPAEELVFRGVVQGLFRRAWGVVPAVVVTSLVFGVVHVAALSGSGKLTYIGVVAVLGLVLGGVYERTDNIVVPIVIHGVWNVMLFVVNWAVIVYDVPVSS